MLQNISGAEIVKEFELDCDSYHRLKFNTGIVCFKPYEKLDEGLPNHTINRLLIKNLLIDATNYLVHTYLPTLIPSQEDTYTFLFEQIITAFLNVISKSNDQRYHAINSPSTIKSYFKDYQPIVLTIESNSLSEKTKNIKLTSANLQDEFNIQNYFDGDWLSASEIESLIKDTVEKEHANALDHTWVWTCLNDEQNVELNEQIEHNEKAQDILQLLSNPDSYFTGVIVLHNNTNHWLTFVVFKKKDKITYLAVDSLAQAQDPTNSIITANPAIQELATIFNSAANKTSFTLAFIRFFPQENSSSTHPAKQDEKSNQEKNEIVDDNTTSGNFIKPTIDFKGLGSTINKEIQDIIAYLNNIKIHKMLNLEGKIRPLIILHGELGNGKSTLAEAMAAEANRLFLRLSIGQMSNNFMNSMSDALKNLFKTVHIIKKNKFLCDDTIKDSHGEYERARAEFYH